jgi:GDP-4-dehydro-6-deoxy-D-mannose reductase
VKQTALLIGGTGFVGWHMQQVLQPQFNVVATGHAVDIRDAEQIGALVKSVGPHVVINFASVTTVRESFEDPLNAYRIGFLGTLNLLLALKEHGFRGRMLSVSSSEVYGFPSSDELPTSEAAILRPMSPYSVSKAATEALCYQWSQTEQFDIVTARPFTHIGPGQSDRFAVSNFTKQISEILLEKRVPVIRVGDLQTTRDFTDVRDVVCAYQLLLEKGRSGQVYNVCSGQETSLRSLLSELITIAGVSIRVEQDEGLMRQAEQRRTCGSYQKIHKEIGWSPTIPLSRTLADMLAYWSDKSKEVVGDFGG